MPYPRGKLRALLSYTIHRELKPGQTFWRRLKPGLVLIVMVTLINGACHRAGLYERFEWTDSDKLLRSTIARSDVPPQHPVVVVKITDDIYKNRFLNRSPLRAVPLVQIVNSVCKLNPCRVGVDIFTSDWQPQERDKVTKMLAGVPASRIVWIRDSVYESQEVAKPYFQLGKVWGAALPPQGVCTALPVFQPDADGVIRRFDPYVPAAIDAATEPAPYPTLAETLTTPNECGLRMNRDTPPAESKKINFAMRSQIRYFDAETIVDAARSPNSPYARGLGVGNAIVIIGGFYRYARDEYITPVGQLFGAEIIANAIRAPGIKDVGLPLVLAVEFAIEVALLALVLTLNLRLPWALLCSVLLSACAAFVLSWKLFNFGGYFLGVFGALGGVGLGVIAEVVWEPFLEEWRHWKHGFLKIAKTRIAKTSE